MFLSFIKREMTLLASITNETSFSMDIGGEKIDTTDSDRWIENNFGLLLLQ